MAAEDADIVVFMDGDGADDPQAIARLVEPIRSGRYDFVIGSRARGKREPGSIAWHQLAAGRLAGWGMRLLYGVRYTDMCAFRAIRRDALLELGMRELDLWLEHRDADARRPRRAAHPGDSGRLSSPQRRPFEGGGKPVRNDSRRHAHHRDFRAGCAGRRHARRGKRRSRDHA